jgi:ubiquinone/menaquinone biosynthesis C-methylase UbiE
MAIRNPPKYSNEPEDKEAFTASWNAVYSRSARVYDLAVKCLPFWKAWLRQAIPHIEGRRVLEVSFGTGYLLTQYAGKFETYGIDYNRTMVETARKNLTRMEITAQLQQGNVLALPYRGESFHTIVSTMALSGYPDANQALSEMRRVLKQGAKLILIDVNFPADRNWLGTKMANGWKLAGDLVRDIGGLLRQFDFDYTDEEIGAFGSIHLYVARKR